MKCVEEEYLYRPSRCARTRGTSGARLVAPLENERGGGVQRFGSRPSEASGHRDKKGLGGEMRPAERKKLGKRREQKGGCPS